MIAGKLNLRIYSRVQYPLAIDRPTYTHDGLYMQVSPDGSISPTSAVDDLALVYTGCTFSSMGVEVRQ